MKRVNLAESSAMNPARCIAIVSGAPATGKSTLGRNIANQLVVPFLEKDDILESLFVSLGTGDQKWRTRLSRTGDDLFPNILNDLPWGVAVSFWRHPYLPEWTPGRQLRNSAMMISRSSKFTAAVTIPP